MKCIINIPDGINQNLCVIFPGKTKMKIQKIAITDKPLQGLPIQTG